MVSRAVLVALLLLGLAIGVCGGVEQAGLGRSIYLVSEVAKKVDAEPAAGQLGEARQTLDACFNLTTASMYLGVAVGLVAILGLSVPKNQPPSGV